MNDTRRLLDQLMGVDRDGRSNKHIPTDFRDKDVCRLFLAGLCPNDLFQNTKSDLGPCLKIHSEDLREQFQRHVTKTGDDYGYEAELIKVIDNLIYECDRKIRRAQKEIDIAEPITQVKQDSKTQEELDTLMIDAHEAMLKAESYGEKGMIDSCLAAMSVVEELRYKKLLITGNSVGGATIGSQQKQRVCLECSAKLSLLDNDVRLADHYGGKAHMGYKKLRCKLEELRQKKIDRQTTNTASSSNNKVSRREGEGSRKRSRSPPSHSRT